MALTIGTRLGPYEIQSAIGAGGMGEVYKARDTRLERTVAIKILSEALASDPIFRERFDREAKAIAALQHPHICTLFDVGHQDGVNYLVLEYLDGQTLAERLTKGALPIDQALTYAIQIADALDRAHRAGIVHRDLKPGNVMLTKAGVKLLDFGLAKTQPGGAGAAGALSALPTVADLTAHGTILGTFQYMAPEQLEGQDADARTDVFALGAVVYEMVTGKKAFEGKSQASLIGAILEREPSAMSALQPHVSALLDHVVSRCLSKAQDERWQSAGDVMRELKWLETNAASLVGHGQGERPGKLRGRGPGRFLLPWVVAGALGAALTAVVVAWAPWRAGSAQAALRFEVLLRGRESVAFDVQGRGFALSPDGTRLVYNVRDGNQAQLMMRSLDDLEAEPLTAEQTGPRSPFFSPDGRWVGYFAGSPGFHLKKVSITGGPAQIVCGRCGEGSLGASWGPDDTIVFATADVATGLMSVPASGGEPKVLTRPDPSHDEADHVFPSMLPGGRAVLFTILSAAGSDDSSVAVLDLQTGLHKVLVRGGRDAVFVDSGHLVYASAGTLRAVRFDAARLDVIGDPVTLIEGVEPPYAGDASFSVSRTGTLVYAPAGAGATAARRSLVWVDRSGREEIVTGAPVREYYALRLSPDGTRVALGVGGENADIWVWEFARRTLTRLTSDLASDVFPIWTPDGRDVVFRRVGENAVVKQSVDGGQQERLHRGNGLPLSFTPDGMTLLLISDGEMSLLPIGASGEVTPLWQTKQITENLGQVSMDGRWLAYQTNESGRNEIHVRPFPDVNSGGRWTVSTAGGTKPVWAPNGRELFYLDADDVLTVVPVQTTPTFRPGTPVKMLATSYFSRLVNGRAYDVAPDGRRFLMIKELPGAGDEVDTVRGSSVVVVLNWTEELKRLEPRN